MSQELHYTSVPRGLLPGTRGFCTVASTAGMPGVLRERLEGLSGYRQVIPPHDPDAALNPVAYSHHRLNIGGRLYSVLSRVAAAGLDYSSRANKYAHHVVLSPEERPAGGPAWLLAQPGFMESTWRGEPTTIEAGRVPPRGDSPPGIARAWEALTGDAGWAGALAESFLADPTRVVALVYRPGTDLLPLLAEALALLPPTLRWDVDFNTYFTGLPQGLTCAWRGVLEGSPEAAQAARLPNCLRIDVSGSPGKADGGDLVRQARTGERPRQAYAPARPRTAPADPRHAPARDDAPIDLVPLPPDAPHIRLDPTGRLMPDDTPRRRAGLIALIAAACLLLVGGGALWLVGSDRILGALGLRSKADDAILAMEAENAQKKQAAEQEAAKVAEAAKPPEPAPKKAEEPPPPKKAEEPAKVAEATKPQPPPKIAEAKPPPQAPAENLGTPRSRPALFVELPSLVSGLAGGSATGKTITIPREKLGPKIGKMRLRNASSKEDSPIVAIEVPDGPGLKIAQNSGNSTLGEVNVADFTQGPNGIQFQWTGDAAGRLPLTEALRNSVLEVETDREKEPAFILLRETPLPKERAAFDLVGEKQTSPKDLRPRKVSRPWVRLEEDKSRQGIPKPDKRATTILDVSKWPLSLDRWRIDVTPGDKGSSMLLGKECGEEPSATVECPVGDSGYVTLKLALDGPMLNIALEFDEAKVGKDRDRLKRIPRELEKVKDRLDELKDATGKEAERERKDLVKEKANLEQESTALQTRQAELERITKAKKADLSFTVVLKLDDGKYIEFAQFGKYAETGKKP